MHDPDRYCTELTLYDHVHDEGLEIIPCACKTARVLKIGSYGWIASLEPF